MPSSFRGTDIGLRSSDLAGLPPETPLVLVRGTTREVVLLVAVVPLEVGAFNSPRNIAIVQRQEGGRIALLLSDWLAEATEGVWNWREQYIDRVPAQTSIFA